MSSSVESVYSEFFLPETLLALRGSKRLESMLKMCGRKRRLKSITLCGVIMTFTCLHCGLDLLAEHQATNH